MIRILGRGGGTAEPRAAAAGELPENAVQAEPLSYEHHRQDNPAYQPYPPPSSYRAQAYPMPAAHPYQHDPSAHNPYYRTQPTAEPMARHVRIVEDVKLPWYKRIGVLTILIIVACIAVFIATMGVNNCPANFHYAGMYCVFPWLGRFSFEPLKMNPMLGPTSNTLLDMGALFSTYVLDYHQSWRLLTAMWLHAGIVHIVSNMLGIYFLGVPMERDFGFLKMGVIYLLSGISGAIFSSLLLMNAVSVGASGALFGLAGATLTELCINWDLYVNRVSAFLSLLILIIINLAIGLMPYIDNFAHIGGCLAGLFLGLVLLVKPQRGWVDLRERDSVAQAAAAAEAGGVVVSSRNTMCQNVTRIVAAIFFLALFFAGLGLVLSGTHANCSWCQYLSCVPTSLWDCNAASNPSTQGAGPICQQITYPNGTGTFVCTDNRSKSFPNMTSYSDYDLRVLCTQTCS